MNTQFDVVVVSSYGRGHWFAQELNSLQLKVALIDVSDFVGRQPPEDIEGPFGFFDGPLISPSQKLRLEQEDYSDLVDDGFVVWLKSGPIDTRGIQAPQLLSAHGISGELREYVEQYDQKSEKQRFELLKKLLPQPFVKNWFAQLAHSLGSPVGYSSTEALTHGRPLPLFSSLAIRRVSRMGYEKSLTWLKSKGVEVFKKAKVTDVSVRGGEMQNIEVSSEWSGIMGAEQFVWSLTSEETARLSPKVLESLFGSGELKPDWVWARYRFEIRGEPLLASLPSKILVIEDEALPWSHANLLWLQRTVNANVYDVWMRLPVGHRFQKAYHENIVGEALRVLRTRLPGGEVKVSEYPQEYHYDEAIVGPARFQVYDPVKWQKHKPRRLTNVSFDSPELWAMLDWNGQFEYQSQIFSGLKAWKIERDLKIEKQRAKELEKLK